MKKIFLVLMVLISTGCAHKTLKASKKAPCDFENQVISEGYEDNTK